MIHGRERIKSAANELRRALVAEGYLKRVARFTRKKRDKDGARYWIIGAICDDGKEVWAGAACLLSALGMPRG